MKIQFLGAAGVVTGSRTLVTSGATRLLVDCGMFQGHKQNRLRNWEPLDVAPLDAVVLTHAHIDHSGWVPALIRQGYDGPVCCTPGTAALLSILWPDAGRIQEEDAAYQNKKGSSKHSPALPMFTEADALRALKNVVPVESHAPHTVAGIEITFRDAGHILGASSVVLHADGQRLLFSGDLGRPDDRVIPAPEPPPEVDVVVMESTYGNRVHPDVDQDTRLAEIINRTVQDEGMVLIPSFAVGRAQGLLWSLHLLMESGRIPRLPIVVDSPMATSATDAFLAHPEALRLEPAQLRAMTRNVQFVGSVEESRALNDRLEPFILIAASGMLTGGRVLHHLRERAPVKRNTLLFVGFQAPGTRGARLLEGEKTFKMFGSKVKVRCSVESITGFSAHADSDELVTWLSAAPTRPKRVFLNHGEPDAVDALRIRLGDLGYTVVVATEGVRWDLATDAGVRLAHHASGEAAPETSLLARASSLVFDTPDDATVRDVRFAIQGMRAGTLPVIPIVVRGHDLALRVREMFPAAQLTGVRFEDPRGI